LNFKPVKQSDALSRELFPTAGASLQNEANLVQGVYISIRWHPFDSIRKIEANSPSPGMTPFLQNEANVLSLPLTYESVSATR
jgi:hypothetical protein